WPAPFHWTTEPETKPEPFTVRVKPAEPASAELGLIEEVCGTGLATVKAAGAELPPPGEGLSTVTLEIPAEAMSAAWMAAWSGVEEKKVVAGGEPFHCTTAPEAKEEPATTR